MCHSKGTVPQIIADAWTVLPDICLQAFTSTVIVWRIRQLLYFNGKAFFKGQKILTHQWQIDRRRFRFQTEMNSVVIRATRQ